MKRISLLLMVAFVAGAAAAAFAMDVDELVAKTIEAQGGKENTQAVKSMKTTGKFMMMGMDFPFTTYHLRPGKMRIESTVQGAVMVQCFDGEVGWMVNPMMGSSDPQKMPSVQEKNFKFQADMDGYLIDWKEKGYTIEYIGTDDVEGTEVHHLKVDTNQEFILDIYIDSEYFLPIKITTKGTEEGSEFEADTFMSDYKEVGKLVVPHSIDNRMEGQTVNQILLETIEYDVEIDPTIFVMPEKEEAAEEEAEKEAEKE